MQNLLLVIKFFPILLTLSGPEDRATKYRSGPRRRRAGPRAQAQEGEPAHRRAHVCEAYFCIQKRAREKMNTKFYLKLHVRNDN